MKKVRNCSTLLASQSWSPGNLDALNNVLRGLGQIALHQNHYCRSLYYWSPPATSSLRLQFRSLLEHLLARYRVPGFLSNAWIEHGQYCRRDRRLFLEIANGKSLPECDLPIHITRSTRRWFMQAPDDLSVNQALRWAQVRARDGNDQLARILVNAIPVPPGLHEEFWSQVIGFFVRVNQPRHDGPICDDEIRQIVRFIHEQNFLPASHVLRCRVMDESPLQPELILIGRSLRNLRQMMANWREQLADEIRVRLSGTPQPTPIWKPSKIRSLNMHDQGTWWTISELLAERELAIEGAIMHHCVGSDEYVSACKKRTTTIWSLRKATARTSKRMVTIEVDPETREIVQASAKCNNDPTDQSLRIIREWARREKLLFEEL